MRFLFFGGGTGTIGAIPMWTLWWICCWIDVIFSRGGNGLWLHGNVSFWKGECLSIRHKASQCLQFTFRWLEGMYAYIRIYTYTQHPKRYFSKSKITCALITGLKYSLSASQLMQLLSYLWELAVAKKHSENNGPTNCGPNFFEARFTCIIQTFRAHSIATYCAHNCFHWI